MAMENRPNMEERPVCSLAEASAFGLEAHALRFRCRAETTLVLPPFKGASIRGALFSALRRRFCMNPDKANCEDAGLRKACPVCALLATVNEDASRGLEAARPCTVEPPTTSKTLYREGEELAFGITVFGQAAQLMPYVVLGALSIAETGMGDRSRAAGIIRIDAIESYSPLIGRQEVVYRRGASTVRADTIKVTHADVLSVSRELGGCSRVTLDIRTPMRLVVAGRLVKSLTFEVFVRRLLRRLADLSVSACGVPLAIDHQALLAAATGVHVAEDRTRWVDVPSFSSRHGRFTPIGGLLGSVTFEGELDAFVPWLLWGSITHVGKDATKGGGWYRLKWPS
jgi:hypothetical protein